LGAIFLEISVSEKPGRSRPLSAIRIGTDERFQLFQRRRFGRGVEGLAPGKVHEVNTSTDAALINHLPR
jgi:hypothetical protein